MRGRWCVSLAVLVGLGTAPRAVRSQDRDPPAAEALFQRGRAAMEAGNLAEACASFAESYRLDATVGTLLNQAQCEEQRGQLAEAWEHFRTAVEQLPATDERHPLAVKRAAALDVRVPRLTLSLAAPAPPRSRVLRDRVELRSASLGVALPLNPGVHSVELLVPGHEPRSWSLEIREGERRELSLAPGPALAASVSAAAPLAPPPASAASPARGGRSVVGWSVGSVGAAALLTSVGLGIWAYERRQYVREHCPDNRCDPGGLQASGELKSLTRVSTGAFLAGVLGLGAGTYLVLRGEF